MAKLLNFLDDVFIYFIISGSVSIGITIFLPTWRKNLGFLLVSLIIGSFIGYGVGEVPAIADWDVLAGIAATLLATPLVMWAGSGGDAKALANDIIEIAEYLKDRKTSKREDGGIPRNESE